MSSSRRHVTRRARRLAALGLAAAAVVAAGVPAGAQAQKIANPSPPAFSVSLVNGALGIGTGLAPFSLDFTSLGLTPPVWPATVDAQGNVTIAKSGITFPVLTTTQVVSGLGAVTIHIAILPTSDFTGRINPLTGRMDLDANVRVHATADGLPGVVLGNGCYVGGDGSGSTPPIHLALRNYAGAWPATDAPYEVDFAGTDPFFGLPYSDEAGTWLKAPGDTSPVARPAGTARVGDNGFLAPASSGCGSLAATIDSTIGLPATGQGFLDIQFVPNASRTGSNAILQKGVAARFTAPGVSTAAWPASETPSVLSGVPFTLDASSTLVGTVPGAQPYAWDLGTGTFGAPTADPTRSATLATPGLTTVRLRATDKDGDADVRTRTLNVIRSTDIGVSSSVPGGRLRGGSPATYAIAVTNHDPDRANTQPITFTQTIPAGTSLVSYDAPGGWTCSSTSTLITCTRATGTLAAGATSNVSMTVLASPLGAPGASTTATSTVAQAGDPDGSNDAFALTTPVGKTDLRATLSHVAPQLTANGTYPFDIQVDNVGDGDTSGTTTVITDIPAGMSYVADGSGGAGWTCGPGPADGQARCTRPPTSPILGNTSAPAISLRLKVDRHTPAGTLTPTTTVSTAAGDDNDLFGGGNASSDPAQVVVRPDLSVNMSHSGSFVVGSTEAYAIQVDNESVVPADGPTTVSYPVPAGLTLHGLPDGGADWDCSTSTATQLTCTDAAAIPAESAAAPIAVLVDVDHPAHPSVASVATLANDADGYAGNDADTDETTVHRIDLSVTLSAPRGFAVGQDGSYRISVANHGDADTTGPIAVRLPLPATISLKHAAGAGWDCAASAAQLVSCVRAASLTAGSAAPLVNVTVNVSDQAAADGSVEATASVDTDRDARQVAADDPVNGDNTSTLTVPAVSVDLAIREAHVNPFRVGQDGEISLKVVNVGSFPTVPGTPVTVVDRLPAGLVPQTDAIAVDRSGWACSAAGSVVTCTGTPEPGASIVERAQTVSIDIPVTVTDEAADADSNVATVSTEKDDDPVRSVNNAVTSAVAVTRVDLALEASQSIAPRVGGIGEITASVANAGSAPTTGTTTVDVALPVGVTYRPAGSQVSGWACAQSGAALQCRRSAPVPAGEAAPPLRLRTDVTAAAPDSWTSAVTASTPGEPPTRLADDVAQLTVTLERVDLALTKAHAAGGIQAGRRGAYTLTVRNVGNTASRGTVRVTDRLDDAFGDVRAHGEGWTCAVTAGALDCRTTDPIPAGASAPPITETAAVAPDAGGTHESQPVAAVAHDDDPYPANDDAPDPTTIVGTADLALARTQPSAARVGDTITVRYKVTNVGTEPADGAPAARLTDVPSAGLTPVAGSESSADDWDCDFAGGTVACDLATAIAPDASSILTVRFHVGPSAAPQAATFGAVRLLPADPNPANDQSGAVIDIGSHDLSLTAEARDAQVGSGTQGTYDLRVHNDGDQPTTGPVVVSLPLPGGMTLHETASYGTGWACSTLGGTPRVECRLAGPVDGGQDAPLLTVQLTPSPANAPTVRLAFTVSTPGDEDDAGDTAELDQAVQDTTPPPPVDPTQGSKTATLIDGTVAVGTLGALAFGDGQLTLSGDVSAGQWTVPQGGVHFDPIEVPVQVPGSTGSALTIKAALFATRDGTGHLPDHGDGPADLDLSVSLKVEAYAGTVPLLGPASNCTLGPIDFDLHGSYDATTKEIILGSDDVTLPTASAGCGSLGATVNTLLSLPASGNSADFRFRLGDTAPPDDDTKTTPTVTTTTTTTVPGPPTTQVVTVTTPAKGALGRISSTVSSSGRMAVPVLCVGLPGQTCSGRVALTTKRGRTTVTIGSATFSKVSGSTVRSASMRLSTTGRKLLAKAGRKGLKAIVALTPAGATRPLEVKALTLKPARKAAKRARRH